MAMPRKAAEMELSFPDHKTYPHQLHVYTGDNKGKTTASIGMAIRALGAGLRVTLIQFDKGYSGDDEHYSERNILRTLPNLELIPTGMERMQPGKKFRFGVTEEDRGEARRAMDTAAERIENGNTDLLILDEILSAITYHLVQKDDVIALLDQWREKRPFELVLTGRRLPDEVLERADLVTDMTKVKHYFDQGIPARRGYDF